MKQLEGMTEAQLLAALSKMREYLYFGYKLGLWSQSVADLVTELRFEIVRRIVRAD